MAEQVAHNHKVVGSTPTPATKPGKGWARGLSKETDPRIKTRSAPPGLRPPWKKGDGVASQLRQEQLRHEEAEADRLRAEGFEVFSPTVVCDRIAVKDGKVYFVEFKRPGQYLRPAQQKVSELVPDRYLVRYSGS